MPVAYEAIHGQDSGSQSRAQDISRGDGCCGNFGGENPTCGKHPVFQGVDGYGKAFNGSVFNLDGRDDVFLEGRIDDGIRGDSPSVNAFVGDSVGTEGTGCNQSSMNGGILNQAATEAFRNDVLGANLVIGNHTGGQTVRGDGCGCNGQGFNGPAGDGIKADVSANQGLKCQMPVGHGRSGGS